MGINMKLVIELTNGKRDACGDCECVAELLAGETVYTLESVYGHKIPNYYFEED
jgi:hypothetical protein